MRGSFARLAPRAELRLLYDVSHNTCKLESHRTDGRTKRVFVHRKGATRAFGPGHPDLPPAFAAIGQPVLIGPPSSTLPIARACLGRWPALNRSSASKASRPCGGSH